MTSEQLEYLKTLCIEPWQTELIAEVERWREICAVNDGKFTEAINIVHAENDRLRKQLALCKEQRDEIIRTWDTSTFSGVEKEYKESIDELDAELEAIT